MSLSEILKVLTKAFAPFAAMALGQLLIMQEYLVAAVLVKGCFMVGVGLYGPPKLSSLKSTKNLRNAAILLGCFIFGMVWSRGLLPASVGYPLAIIGIVPWQRAGRLVKFLGIAIPLTSLSMPLLEGIMPDFVEANVLHGIKISVGMFASAAMLDMLGQKDRLIDRLIDRRVEQLVETFKSSMNEASDNITNFKNRWMQPCTDEERETIEEHRGKSLEQ